MNPDGTQDVYLRSWYGVGPDGANNNYLSLDERGTTINQPNCSAPLKFTRQFQSNLDCTVHFGTVYAGRENVLDVNDRSRLIVSFETLVLTGSKYGVTCKGGSYLDLTGKVLGHGKECDVDYGNYSDQWPRGKSAGRLNLTPVDGSLIMVRCLQATKPTLVPGSGPYQFTFPSPDSIWHDLIIEGFLLIQRNKKTIQAISK